MIFSTGRTFLNRFDFIVQIDGFGDAAFMTASGLGAETSVIENYEGGRSFPRKTPGRTTFSDVTLERGMTVGDVDFDTWYRQVMNASVSSPLSGTLGAGVGVPDLYKRQVDIVALGRDKTPAVRHRLFNAWPSAFSPGDYDASSDELVVESLTLTYELFVRL